MEAIGLILVVLGGIVAVIGGLWFLLVAFQESVLWGVGCLFVPFVSLIFLIMYWDNAGKPFLVQLAGAVPMVLGIVLMGGTTT